MATRRHRYNCAPKKVDPMNGWHSIRMTCVLLGALLIGCQLTRHDSRVVQAGSSPATRESHLPGRVVFDGLIEEIVVSRDYRGSVIHTAFHEMWVVRIKIQKVICGESPFSVGSTVDIGLHSVVLVFGEDQDAVKGKVIRLRLTPGHDEKYEIERVFGGYEGAAVKVILPSQPAD